MDKLVENYNNGYRLKTVEYRFIRAYADSEDKETLVFDSFNGFFPNELVDASNVMDSAGIDSFISFDNSTALMDTLQHFLGLGYTIEPVIVNKGVYIQKGLKFTR